MRTVYVSLIADLLHAGHIKILKEAEKRGRVVVGLLTSSAISELNDIAYLKYDHRQDVLLSLTMIDKVVPQSTASYQDNLLSLKPDFVVHGNDWINNDQSKYRQEVIDVLSTWGGELIEVEYSSDISDNNIKNQLMKLGVTTVQRLGRLRKLIKDKPIVHILEAHSALSGLIAENTEVKRNGQYVSLMEFGLAL